MADNYHSPSTAPRTLLNLASLELYRAVTASNAATFNGEQGDSDRIHFAREAVLLAAHLQGEYLDTCMKRGLYGNLCTPLLEEKP